MSEFTLEDNPTPQIGEGLQEAQKKAESILADEGKEFICTFCEPAKKLKSKASLEAHQKKFHKDSLKQEQAQDEKLQLIIAAIKARLGESSVDLIKNLASLAAKRELKYPSDEFKIATASLHSLCIEWAIEKWSPGESQEIVLVILSVLLQWNEFFKYNISKQPDSSRDTRQRENASSKAASKAAA